MTDTNITPANFPKHLQVRAGSIIEITSVGEDSSWYEDWKAGTLPIILRVKENTQINTYKDVYGITDADTICSMPYNTCICDITYKVLWY